jgi:dTDP-glucose 4,6-dehydratase
MKVLVTGGAGFIGSNFIHYMLEVHPEIEIINLDKLTYCGNPDNLKDVEADSRYRFVKGDIADHALIKQLLPEIDAVVHFAAESHVDRSILEPAEFIKTNVLGLNTLLTCCLEAKINRFLNVSTDEVYGSIDKGYFSEEDRLNPSSPYSASKAAGDLLCNSYWITYGFPVLTTRSTNNFGPFQYPEKLIPLLVTNALEGVSLPLYGDGLNMRDWIYVIDNCEAIDLVLNKGKEGEVYNIGGANEKKNIEIARKILGTLRKPEDLIEYVADRPGHDRRYAVNTTKLSEIGFSPKHSFEEAMELTVEWYRDNKWWWEKLKHAGRC